MPVLGIQKLLDLQNRQPSNRDPLYQSKSYSKVPKMKPDFALVTFPCHFPFIITHFVFLEHFVGHFSFICKNTRYLLYFHLFGSCFHVVSFIHSYNLSSIWDTHTGVDVLKSNVTIYRRQQHISCFH